MEKDVSKKIPNIVSPMVKIHKKDDESTVFRVLGVPYYGPESLGFKDLHGEFFSKSTDFAMTNERIPLMSNVISFYDHAYNENVGTDPIGTAKFVEETEKGQIWDIEIRRAYRYLDMLELMASKNLLGASSQPVQSAVEIDWQTGFIKRWPVAEMSLTPQPANPLAVAEVMKSFGFERNLLMEEKDPTLAKTEVEGSVTPPVEEPVMEAATEEPVEQPTETKTEGETEPTLEEEINSAFTEDDSATDPNLVEVAKALNTLIKCFNDLDTKIETISKTVTASDERSKAVVLEVSNVKNGLKALAKNVAKSVRFEMSEELQRRDEQPADEQEAERNLRKNISTFIPDNAPGFSKVGN